MASTGDTPAAFLNGEPIAGQALRDVVASLCNPDVIRAKGGFLFKASLPDAAVHLGILPYFIGTERCYHYNIVLPVADPYRLTGFINSNLSLTLLVDADNLSARERLSDEDRRAYADRFRRFAAFLLRHGFEPEFPIDQVTAHMLQSLGAPPVSPATVAGLSAMAERPAG